MNHEIHGRIEIPARERDKHRKRGTNPLRRGSTIPISNRQLSEYVFKSVVFGIRYIGPIARRVWRKER